MGAIADLLREQKEETRPISSLLRTDDKEFKRDRFTPPLAATGAGLTRSAPTTPVLGSPSFFGTPPPQADIAKEPDKPAPKISLGKKLGEVSEGITPAAVATYVQGILHPEMPVTALSKMVPKMTREETAAMPGGKAAQFVTDALKFPTIDLAAFVGHITDAADAAIIDNDTEPLKMLIGGMAQDLVKVRFFQETAQYKFVREKFRDKWPAEGFFRYVEWAVEHGLWTKPTPKQKEEFEQERQTHLFWNAAGRGLVVAGLAKGGAKKVSKIENLFRKPKPEPSEIAKFPEDVKITKEQQVLDISREEVKRALPVEEKVKAEIPKEEKIVTEEPTRQAAVAKEEALIPEKAVRLAKKAPEPTKPEVVKPTEKAKEIVEKEFGPKRKVGIPTELEGLAKERTVSARDVVKSFETELNAVIRTGHMGVTPARGFFKVKPEVIRSKKALDIPVLTHEVAHLIDKQYGLKKRFAKEKELQKLDYEYPEKQRVSEGFAEFMRLWVTGHDVTKHAPKFAKTWKAFLNETPDLANALKQSKGLVDRYRQQGATERVWSQIDMKGKGEKKTVGERAGELKRKAIRIATDDIYTIEWAEKHLRGVKRLDPMKIDPAESPTMMIRADAKTAGAKAKMMVMDGTYDYAGKKSGMSLHESLKNIKNKEQLKEFTTYAYARRAIDLAERGIDAGIDLVDARYVVEKFDSPVYKKTLQNVTDWNGRVLDYLVEAGGLDPKIRVLMSELNPAYIPLKRVFEESVSGRSVGKKFGDLGQPVKKIKGSGRLIKNPYEAMIENTAQIIATADKIRAGRSFVELAVKTEGGGRWIEKIPPDKQAMGMTLESLKPQLEKLGVDLSRLTDTQMQDILTVYGNKPFYLGKDNIVTFWKGGKRHWYEVHPELYKSIMAIDVPQRPILYQIFSAPTRAVRVGATSLQAGFAWITNPIRDAWTFALQTAYGTSARGATAQVRGLAAKFKSTDNYKLFMRSGTDMSTFLGLDKKSIRNAVTQVMANEKKAKALNIVKHPIEVTKEILSVTESATRVAEFGDALKVLEAKWGKRTASARIGAALAASEVTVNFRRMGTYGAILNDFTAFFNATIQGPARMYRFAKEHPVKAVTRATALITAPTIALWMANRDEDWYKDMPTWQKYGFWNFKVGDTIVRIPRPFEWGFVFGSLPEAFLNKWYEDDPKAFNEAIAFLVDQSTPSLIPDLVRPLIEVSANYDFFRDRPIVGYYESKKPPELQYREWTPETYKELSRLLGYIPSIANPELSPLQIGHLIEAYSGGLGGDVVWAAEGAAKGMKFDSPSDLPIVGRLFGRERTKEQILKGLDRERQDEIAKIKAWLKEGKKEKAKKAMREWNKAHPDAKIK